MSSYQGTELGNILVDEVLAAYGEERVDNSKYRLVETSTGVRVVEYDKDDEYVGYKQGDTSEKEYKESYEDVISDIQRGKKKSEGTKYLRYCFISICIMLFALAVIVVLLNK